MSASQRNMDSMSLAFVDMNWRLNLRHEHKWFSSICRESEDGWNGLHDTIGQAVFACAVEYDHGTVVHVAQGCEKSTKSGWKRSRRKKMDVRRFWEVDVTSSIEVRVPL